MGKAFLLTLILSCASVKAGTGRAAPGTGGAGGLRAAQGAGRELEGPQHPPLDRYQDRAGAALWAPNQSRWLTVAVTSGISLLLLVGALVGVGLLASASKSTLAAALAFGAAALLYLVTEELLVETTLPEETLLSTAVFFLGFLATFALVSLRLGD